ncbi:MAG TPA: FAD-dependent monooxygenase [Pyrinomonadaceae bacterium]|nr:FAD-dependent monooxygenase [Pyrinomonadaceae bacterium]
MVQIAIIGGGIGGLTAAIALRQSGFECEVFEQAPALLDVGAAIALWPNAMRVLQRLNLAEKILERAGVMKEIVWLDQHGMLINRVSIADSEPAVALHRADLQHILARALPSESIHLAHALVNQTQRGDKMIATFANGRAIASDFLIGADGIHSRVRAQLINDGEPIYRGYTVWRGISPTAPRAIPPAAAIEIHGRGKRFGIGPVGLGRIGWWAAANTPHTNDLLELFAGWYPPLLELIQTTPASSILTTTACDRNPNKIWGSGRMTLLGDAIHPTTPNLGQGGCLAMEDAIVLVRCFERHGASEEALRNYEHARYKRTTAISKYSRYYGRIGQSKNIWARALRRTTLALIPEALAQRLMQIVFHYDAVNIPFHKKAPKS